MCNQQLDHVGIVPCGLAVFSLKIFYECLIIFSKHIGKIFVLQCRWKLPAVLVSEDDQAETYFFGSVPKKV